MYEEREGRITPDFLPNIKFYKNTTGSIMYLTRENLKFKISAPGAYSRINGIFPGSKTFRIRPILPPPVTFTNYTIL